MLAIASSDSHLRKKPIQARSRRTVEAILEATDRVLRNEGYEGASTNRIAEVAGYSVGSLYQYFSDKESVVRTLVDQALAQEDQVVARRVAELLTEPLEGAVHGALDFMMQGRWVGAHVYRVLASEGYALYGRTPLERLAEEQTAFSSSLQQLAVQHWSSLRRDDPAAMLWTFAASAQAVTLGLAANPQVDLTTDQLLGPIAEAWRLALEVEPPKHPIAATLVEEWRDAHAQGRMVEVQRRIPELRSRLLQVGERLDPARMAAVAFALACVPDVISVREIYRPGVSDAAVDAELTILVAALLRAGETDR